jgi:hypothetical protein
MAEQDLKSKGAPDNGGESITPTEVHEIVANESHRGRYTSIEDRLYKKSSFTTNEPRVYSLVKPEHQRTMQSVQRDEEIIARKDLAFFVKKYEGASQRLKTLKRRWYVIRTAIRTKISLEWNDEKKQMIVQQLDAIRIEGLRLQKLELERDLIRTRAEYLDSKEKLTNARRNKKAAITAERDEQRKRTACIRNRKKLFLDIKSEVFESAENDYSELRNKLESALVTDNKTEFRSLLQAFLKKKNSTLLAKATVVPTVFTEIVNGVAEEFREKQKSTPTSERTVE